MNSVTVKIIFTIISLFLIVMISAQTYIISQGEYATEEAKAYSVSDTVEIQGVFVRNEKILDYKVPNGVVNYIHPDGEKIANGSVVAYVYRSADQIEAKNKIEALEFEISELKRAQNKGTTEYAQPEFIQKQIDESYKLLLEYSAENDLENMASVKQEMLTLMNIYNITVGMEDDYQKRIDVLENVILELERVVSEPIDVIKTDETGYFVSYTDGYENILNLDNINSLSIDDIKEILNNPVKQTQNSVGKLFDNYNCKMIGIVKMSNSFIENQRVTLVLDSSAETYRVTVESVQRINSDECIIILDCNQLNEALAKLRVANARLVFKEYKGIKVPRSAIRFKDGEKGVYVVIGQSVAFKKIDVIYEDEDYVLSEIKSDSSYLLQHDHILLEGISADELS